MHSIAFIDTEIELKSKAILDIGCITDDGSSFHKGSIPAFIDFLKGTRFVCGHNVFKHDLQFIGKPVREAGVDDADIIDTLFLSPLLFPTKPYHALLKDDKLQSEDTNNPLNDAIKAKYLFYDEVAAFGRLPEKLQQIYFLLLGNQKEFKGFFRFINYSTDTTNTEALIWEHFKDELCANVALPGMIEKDAIALAYSLALIDSFVANKLILSITPRWVLWNYRATEQLMLRLRNKPCVPGCTYCDKALNIHSGLKKFFGFDQFRTYGGERLQEQAVKAAVDGKSILAVFPTGGGKSITFQVPALMSGESARGLTVVISPLQSLMKDQVDNLEKACITDAVTINGLLDPIERAKSLERVEDGSASILYISPESLRSPTIERLLLGRKIVRFVIDEAHCFSSWGQDFRVDYLYIGDFIRQIQQAKDPEEGIPVSCFTATAKRKVIEDIQLYFKDKLSLELELFASTASRTNLHYKVFEKEDEEQKYQAVRDLVEEKNTPTIVYVSRTRKAYQLAERLTTDGFNAKPYHGKMDVKEKTANQNAFISGEVPIMVATSAFGMGVDKKDVGMVIHYEISDSLENYVQEAGRAGRDENINADCFVLFNEEDLSKHFILLNQTKLSIREIQQVWKAIKDITRFRSKVSHSALEIARKAGWDDSVREIETRVTTAIAALEDAGYLRRGQNMPRIFASSILSKNAQEAIDIIRNSEKFDERQKEQATRIIRKLFASKSRKEAQDEQAESRIDYISEHLGIVKEEVIQVINLLREEKILADTKDLTAFIRKKDNKNRSLSIIDSFSRIEIFLLPLFDEVEKTFHLKELNEQAEDHGCEDVTPQKIKTLINFWAIKHWIRRQHLAYSQNHIAVLALHSKAVLQEKLEKRQVLVRFIVEYLFEKSNQSTATETAEKEEILVEFSVYELKEAFLQRQSLFVLHVSPEDIEDALFYLSKTEAIKIEGGFLVVYNRLTIERLEQDNKKRYKVEDYQKLSQFYENKVQQIHIVGEYAKKMITDYRDALQFVEDYFQLNYGSFLSKYFKGSRQNEIKRNITPAKFRQLFGELSPTQLKLVTDNETKYVVVAAGPGSGKTRVLVHKLASLMLMEDVKHDQMLMITFSRAAATEFKKRLLQLIGNAANFIDIKTFHSYCFDLLGKVGSLEKSDSILKKAIEKIRLKDVETRSITRTVLVIDEAQDMDEDEYSLVRTLMEQNEEMRVIAVGDDDQNIYEFRGASSRYLSEFITVNSATKHELVENYRSKSNLVSFTNQFVQQVRNRLKTTPIIARQADNGKIKVIHYQSNNLVTPVVNNLLSTALAGTTCVLTKTNEEALQVTGLLLQHGMKARLIQTNDGFNLYNLLEIRFFLSQLSAGSTDYTITEEIWLSAKRALVEQFARSARLEVCKNIIKDFEISRTVKKYKSDLEVFIRESKLEDFFSVHGETIFVSTIHKAKGKEFDNVFLLLENFAAITDEAKRQLYVAMTRAKQNLVIHLNSNILDGIKADDFEHIEDDTVYSALAGLVMHLTHKDVWLDYFVGRQHLLPALVSGDELSVEGDMCLNAQGKPVLKFSKRFVEQIEAMRQKGYYLKRAKINFIVYWLQEETGQEFKIILPEVYFERV